MTMLYWNIGKRINEEVLQHKRAKYGKQVIMILSAQLTINYGKGWSEKQLRQCMQLAKSFPENQIVYTPCRELSWSHLRLIMFIEDPLKCSFYIEMCQMEKWSVRTFRECINAMLYERTAISKKPDETIKNELETLKETQQITPDLVFRDPYFLDFLGLQNSYSEKDLESAILPEKTK